MTKWSGPSDETGKIGTQCHSRCGTIKILPCAKAPSAEKKPLEMLHLFTGNYDISI
jgi:hypothetical protein